MLKRLVICAMALVLIGLRCYADTRPAQQAKSSQQPASPVANTAPEQNDSPKLKGIANQHVDADVSVVKTPEKDTYDKIAFWVNAALAGVGIIGVGIGICTLLFLRSQTAHIKRQADLMEAQAKEARAAGSRATEIALATAKSAETSAKAAMGVAIPTLVVAGFDFAEQGVASLEAKLQYPEMRVVVKNLGHSPAILKTYGLKYSTEVIPLNTSIPVAWVFEHGEVIEAGKELALQDGAYTQWDPFPQDVAAILGGEKTVRIAGCLRYGDVFGSPIRPLLFYKDMAIRPDGKTVFWMDSDLGERYRASVKEAEEQQPPKPN